MEYDPFVRGPFPVGVRSITVPDHARPHRALEVEIWYPAQPRFLGLDLSPATQDRYTPAPDTRPLSHAAVRDAEQASQSHGLLLFSHSSYGHRRQAAYLSTHLASHGYTVAAPDHAGNAFGDLVTRAAEGRILSAEERSAYVERINADRVPDLRLVLDSMLDRRTPPVGLIGWSFGGWAVLATAAADERVRAVAALAPAGSTKPVPGIIPVTASFETWRAVETLYLAAERDRATPLDGIVEMFARTPPPKHLHALRFADHDVFADQTEPELVPRQHAHLFTTSLVLSHFDAALRGNRAAARFLEVDAAPALAARGVAVLTQPEA